jgi:ubiquinone/menaquinone biosynthesis C-methylase UbiE
MDSFWMHKILRVTYSKCAQPYDGLHHFKDYASEARAITGLIERYRPGSTNVLELACGSGLFMEQFAQTYSVTGVYTSTDMLAAARRGLRSARLIKEDMSNFNLGRQYDAVLCLFGSIAYVRTLERLY